MDFAICHHKALMTLSSSGPTDTDYDDWNTQKKAIQHAARMPVFKDAEVWWISLGVNVGVETYGKGQHRTRPVIVLRKVSKHGGLVIPVTSKVHTQNMYHELDWGAGPRWAMLHEIRSVSIFRFRSRIATLSDADFASLKTAFRIWAGL